MKQFYKKNFTQESKHSLDTYAVSIESDSLNRDASKPRKSMTRTKSYDEILIDPVKVKKYIFKTSSKIKIKIK
jgi:hypothetical protein